MKDDALIKGFGCAWIIAWTIGAVASVGVTIAIIWAIVKLVQRYG